MNGKQAILRLKAELNQLDTASNRTVRPEYALLYLNKAYDKLAKAKYQKQGNEDTTAFQLNQFLTDELTHLTVPTEVTPTKVEDEYIIDTLELNNYWTCLRLSVKVNYNYKEYWVHNVNNKTLDTVNTVESDPFNRSCILYPVVYFEDSKIKIIAKDFEVSKCKITYYRTPKPITLESEIEAPFADDIIDAAVALILENWGDPRTDTVVAVNKVIDNE